MATARGTFKVTTFGAGGPACGEARRVAKATFGKTVRRRYSGYRCSSAPTSSIAWSCHKRGARNVTLWRVSKPEPTRSISLDVQPTAADPGDTLEVDVSMRGQSDRDAVVLYTTEDDCYQTYGEARNRGDVAVDDWARNFVGSDLLGVYHTSIGLSGWNDQPGYRLQVCALMYDGDRNRTFVTASTSVDVAAGRYYEAD
ncbi:hypothetical protein [Solirubrobacter soli]|uniref:hypothetical protein n=1 Tax=Solirubrobacter soli TaxID=363832 RepID=UPI00041F40CD|nr:hypothetical protein [Solirubrobacter soli]